MTISKTRTTSAPAEVALATSPGQPAAGADAIRPFRIHFPQAALDDLRRRIAATRFPERETVADLSQGVQLATIEAVARYWATGYDWRMCETILKALPNFMTEIDGLDIHFIHVRSRHANALPILVSHGWPGSIIEQLKLIGPLTDPTAFGGRPEDAFDVVIPSMPGYGFSGKPTTAGWDPAHIARAWVVLMKRLGYTRFVAQGGDWGGIVVDQMGQQAAPELLAIHTNMPGAVPVDVNRAAQAGAPAPAGLSAEERKAYEQLVRVYRDVAYAVMMGSRPQTLAGLADSPVGLASFLLDLVGRSREHIARLFVDGEPFGDLTQDDILDNLTLYWLTNTGVSAARLYWENEVAYFDPKGVSIPVAVSVFAEELYQAPRSWAERAYPKLIFYNTHDRGGHFAAWEQPGLLTADLRTAFQSLRGDAESLA